ncbi:MAG: helix-turn-helix domain-containing protein [Eubacterium sp.]|jgi:transcriptional regulator with XRE-family HTH domain|nr:helix-turn-helix transcriptional regulator [Eubacterium sp.]MDE6505774.1 helix-turn-helix domain-containing protein [Eubacterium sp.]
MLNEKIKELRLLNGFNQVELAKRLGLTKQTISNWENNNIQPSIEMLEALADLFSVSTDYLLGRENNRELDSTGLTNEQINHIQQIINDIRK